MAIVSFDTIRVDATKAPLREELVDQFADLILRADVLAEAEAGVPGIVDRLSGGLLPSAGGGGDNRACTMLSSYAINCRCQ